MWSENAMLFSTIKKYKTKLFPEWESTLNQKEMIRKLIHQKTEEANIQVAKILIVGSLLALAARLAFFLHIFTGNVFLSNIALVLIPLLGMFLSFWCLKREGTGLFQQSLLTLIVLWVFTIDVMSGYRVKLLYAIPIMLSIQYYNRKITILIAATEIIALFASIVLNAYAYSYVGFFDLGTISFEKEVAFKMSGFLYRPVMELKPDSMLVLYNGFLISFLPQVVLVVFVTFVAIVIINNNLRILLRLEENMRQENQQILEMKNQILLSQIRPHFLYNTLTTIAYLCKNDPQDAEKLVKRFSRYIRENVDFLSTRGNIPFEKELKHVQNYLEIEKVRFDERIHVDYDIQYTDFEIPMLTLQPLVENAVKHGICKRVEGGTIHIASFIDRENIRIVVDDDGMGFDTDLFQTIIEKEQMESDHVGLANVSMRLEAVGGKLQMTSTPGIGTIAEIYLPADQKNLHDIEVTEAISGEAGQRSNLKTT